VISRNNEAKLQFLEFCARRLILAPRVSVMLNDPDAEGVNSRMHQLAERAINSPMSQ
jgi:hypothetical protein